MLNLSLKELKLIAKNRGIKGYRRMSKEKLLDILNAPKPIKENKTISNMRKDNAAVDKIIKDVRTIFQTKTKENKTIKNKKKQF